MAYPVIACEEGDATACKEVLSGAARGWVVQPDAASLGELVSRVRHLADRIDDACDGSIPEHCEAPCLRGAPFACDAWLRSDPVALFRQLPLVQRLCDGGRMAACDVLERAGFLRVARAPRPSGFERLGDTLLDTGEMIWTSWDRTLASPAGWSVVQEAEGFAHHTTHEGWAVVEEEGGLSAVLPHGGPRAWGDPGYVCDAEAVGKELVLVTGDGCSTLSRASIAGGAVQSTLDVAVRVQELGHADHGALVLETSEGLRRVERDGTVSWRVDGSRLVGSSARAGVALAVSLSADGTQVLDLIDGHGIRTLPGQCLIDEGVVFCVEPDGGAALWDVEGWVRRPVGTLRAWRSMPHLLDGAHLRLLTDDALITLAGGSPPDGRTLLMSPLPAPERVRGIVRPPGTGRAEVTAYGVLPGSHRPMAYPLGSTRARRDGAFTLRVPRTAAFVVAERGEQRGWAVVDPAVPRLPLDLVGGPPPLAEVWADCAIDGVPCADLVTRWIAEVAPLAEPVFVDGAWQLVAGEDSTARFDPERRAFVDPSTGASVAAEARVSVRDASGAPVPLFPLACRTPGGDPIGVSTGPDGEVRVVGGTVCLAGDGGGRAGGLPHPFRFQGGGPFTAVPLDVTLPGDAALAPPLAVDVEAALDARWVTPDGTVVDLREAVSAGYDSQSRPDLLAPALYGFRSQFIVFTSADDAAIVSLGIAGRPTTLTRVARAAPEHAP